MSREQKKDLYLITYNHTPFSHCIQPSEGAVGWQDTAPRDQHLFGQGHLNLLKHLDFSLSNPMQARGEHATSTQKEPAQVGFEPTTFLL